MKVPEIKKPYKKKRKPNVGGDMYFVNCLRAVLGLDRLPGTLDEPPKRKDRPQA